MFKEGEVNRVVGSAATSRWRRKPIQVFIADGVCLSDNRANMIAPNKNGNGYRFPLARRVSGICCSISNSLPMSKTTFSDLSLVNVICFVMNLFCILAGLGKISSVAE